jgi:hypothetical protein
MYWQDISMFHHHSILNPLDKNIGRNEHFAHPGGHKLSPGQKLFIIYESEFSQ